MKHLQLIENQINKIITEVLIIVNNLIYNHSGMFACKA